MAGLKNALIRTALESLYFSGAYIWARPLVGGVGIILTLHHVRPQRRDRFQPNRLLEVTPHYFEHVMRKLGSSYDIVSLDEMARRLGNGQSGRRFACITFDDGYRDTLEFAYPILKKYNIPFGLYIPTSFPDRLGELWWLALEAVVAKQSRITFSVDGQDRSVACGSVAEKREAYEALYWTLRRLKTEDAVRAVVRDLCRRYQVDLAAFCDELCMTWSELAQLASDPLVTIGAHTVNHVMLAKVTDQAVRTEMEMSRAVIESALGIKTRHFAYPVGDATSAGPREFRIAAELGFTTAVTTRPGVIFSSHRDHLMALPRTSLNGDFHRRRYAKVLMSGAATALWNRFRRINVT